MIEIRGASVTAPDGNGGERTILHPTSLSLTERRISIIGANGSGKSTLARLMNGLIEPSAGSVEISVDDVGRALNTARDGAAVRRRVGFVFTDPAAQLIMPTVLEDVSLSLRRSHNNKAERQAAALTTLERYGLDGLADRSVHTLSGGQKQMLAIASVLAAGPAILVADEPTTLLDLRNAHLVGDLLMGLPQQVIVVTHDLEFAQRADRTLVIEAGRVVFDGDPAPAVVHYRALAARS